eukprot:7279239-Prorocentrum_lima.AAC.1
MMKQECQSPEGDTCQSVYSGEDGWKRGVTSSVPEGKSTGPTGGGKPLGILCNGGCEYDLRDDVGRDS